MAFQVTYLHPIIGLSGKRLSTANIIWAERDRGNPYYRVSKFALNRGKFPPNHPAAPGSTRCLDSSELGDSEALRQFRERGYWASCFPEGDGITLKWWDDPAASDRTPEQVIADIRECFGWEVKT